MTNNIDKLAYIEEYYRSFWIYTIDKYNENNQETGVYFWIKKKDNEYHAIFSYGKNGLNIRFLKINEEDLEFVENLLRRDGFKIITTKNDNKLVLIDKERIEKKAIQTNVKATEKQQPTKRIQRKMPITLFVETRHRK